MAHTSKYFTTKPSKGGSSFKRGVRLFLRSGREVGSIAQDRESGKFAVFLVNGGCEEFTTFAEADAYAWAKGV